MLVTIHEAAHIFCNRAHADTKLRDARATDPAAGAQVATFDLPFAIYNGIGFATANRCTSILSQYDRRTATDQSRTVVFNRECIYDARTVCEYQGGTDKKR